VTLSKSNTYTECSSDAIILTDSFKLYGYVFFSSILSYATM